MKHCITRKVTNQKVSEGRYLYSPSFDLHHRELRVSFVVQMVKNLLAMQEMQIRSPGQTGKPVGLNGNPEVLWTEEPGGLHSP